MSFRSFRTALASVALATVVALNGPSALASTMAPPSQPAATTNAAAQAAASYRPFTSANFRYNLVQRTGYDPANCQAHHTIPQKFEQRAGVAGITIHDPAYGLWWISTAGVDHNHSSMASQYNADWDNFFAKNPNATKSQILSFRSYIVQVYQGYYRC